MDLLNLKNIIIRDNKVDYEYECNGIWMNTLKDKFHLEYDIDVSSVPKSILVIPFLCNILPISWVFDLKIETFEIDKNFLDGLKDIKKRLSGYVSKYNNERKDMFK